MSNPTPEDFKSARIAAGLTQTEAANIIHSTCRSVQQWEAGDRRIHPGLWELFLLKTSAIKHS